MGYLIPSLFQSQDPGHETHSKYLTGGTVIFSDADKDIWVSMNHHSKAAFVFCMELIFKEQESFDLKILWLSCWHSLDLWSGAAKLIYSSPYNIELNRIRKGLYLISGDVKSLSANSALQSSWQKGRKNTNTLNIILYSWRYLSILIFQIIVFYGIAICAYLRYPEYFGNPKYRPMLFNLWKECACSSELSHRWISWWFFDYLWCKIRGFNMSAPHLDHNCCSHHTAGYSEV